jgi:SHAQKYF class myb-like DNA-binding protein
MSSLQINSEKKKSFVESIAKVDKSQEVEKADEMNQPRLPTVPVVQEAAEEGSTKNEQSLPENRFKLKPEQSYKKETKASRLGKSTGRWTHREHILFIEGLKIYGKNWKKVESYIGTRTGTQIRSHAQKFFNRIKKEYDTEDPSKYVIDHMSDESIRKIVLEHCGDDESNSNDEKDFSNDTPELLFSITKDKTSKRKRDEVDSTPRSLGASGSAFKSFQRQKSEDHPTKEDSKIHKSNTILQEPA